MDRRYFRIGVQVKVKDPDATFEGIPLDGVVGEIVDENAWEDDYWFVVFDDLTWDNMGHTETVATWFNSHELNRVS